METARRRLFWVGLAALLVGTLVGFMIGKAADNADQGGQGATTKAADARVEFNALLREHVALSVPALKAQFLNQPDADEAMAAVDKNSIMIADQIGKTYDGTRDEFLQQWRSHIDHYHEYLTASRNNDGTSQEQAKQKLTQFAIWSGGFFADRTPSLNKQTLQQSMTTHGEQVLSLIDDLVAGNDDAVYAKAHQAYEHMGSVADVLANAIVSDMPDKL